MGILTRERPGRVKAPVLVNLVLSPLVAVHDNRKSSPYIDCAQVYRDTCKPGLCDKTLQGSSAQTWFDTEPCKGLACRPELGAEPCRGTLFRPWLGSEPCKGALCRHWLGDEPCRGQLCRPWLGAEPCRGALCRPWLGDEPCRVPYDKGSGIAIEVVPPCHHKSDHVRYF